MGRKLSVGGQISRYIRGAFNKAAVGDPEEALALWEKAIKLGYAPLPKTEKGLQIAIRRGLRDCGIRIDANRPSETDTSHLGNNDPDEPDRVREHERSKNATHEAPPFLQPRSHSADRG